jgi:flavin-dependent dehydrogenase
VDAAAAAGVEVREGFVFDEVLSDGNRVTGIRGRAEGAVVEERAKIVVGADGMRSAVAGAVRAEKILERPTLNCAYYSFFSGIDTEATAYAEMVNSECVCALPTHDGLTMVWVGWPHARFGEFKSDIDGNFARTLGAATVWGERLLAGRREERWVGTQDLPNFFRRSHGPGWALAGDAGYHKDPSTAQGISDAFKSAELLAEAIDDGLSGRAPLDDALARYETTRNERAMPIFEWTQRASELKPLSPRTKMLLEAVKPSREHTNRFLGLNAGTVLATDYFSMENIARIVGAVG